MVAETYEMLTLSEVDERYRELRLARPELVDDVRRSMKRHGLLQPLVVNATPDGGRVLLDGFKRLDALRQLGHTEARARVLCVDGVAAQAALITLNTPHRGLSDLEEGWVVRSLVRDSGLKQTEVAELLGRHTSWVCRRLQLAERLASDLQEDMRLGLLRVSTARELARLPRGNQARVAEAVREHGLTARQAARLVDACAGGDPDAVDAVLDDPLRFVAAPAPTTSGPPKDPRLSSAAEAIRKGLLRLSEAAASVIHAFNRHPPHALVDGDMDILHELAAAGLARVEEAAALARRLVRAAPE